MQITVKGGLLLGCAFLFGTAVFAQDYAKVEVPLDYSYMRFNPENSNVVSSFSLNGGGGGATVYINHWVGIEADFQGYASAGTKTFNLPANSLCPGGCSANASADLFTYNAGPIFKYRYSTHIEPFVETLFGGAHSNTYNSLFNNVCVAHPISGASSCPTGTANPSNNAWDFIIGGGLDVPINSRWSIRAAQIDYVLTRFGNEFTRGNQNQSNLRVQAGVVLRF